MGQYLPYRRLREISKNRNHQVKLRGHHRQKSVRPPWLFVLKWRTLDLAYAGDSLSLCQEIWLIPLALLRAMLLIQINTYLAVIIRDDKILSIAIDPCT